MEHETDLMKKYLPQILPPSLYEVCKKFLDAYPDISEIRLRRGKQVTFTLRERNIESGYICDDAIIDSCLITWTGAERYKHADRLINGVISLPHGFRVGVVGTALINNGKLTEVYKISSLNLRIPHVFNGVAVPLYDQLSSLPYSLRSFLLISPPCNGKTTVLRDLAHILSTPPVSERVCVVDTKQELFFSDDQQSLNIDVFSGYPTPIGIEVATRYFNPRYIICDEISTADELEALRNAAHSGIPLIASAHAHSLFDAIQKPVLRTLLEDRIFQNVAELKLTDDGLRFNFFNQREVNQALCLQNSLLQ